MSNTQPVATTIDRLKPLWVILTGGAFVSFAGSALTLMYFWKIGGVPIGQVAGTGAMAKVVLSATFFLAIVFLMAWLAPTLLFQVLTDESPFARRVRRLFSHSGHASPADEPPPVGTSLSAPNMPGAQLVLSTGGIHATSHAPLVVDGLVNLRRVFLFAISTVGSGCIGLTLVTLGVGVDGNKEWTWRATLFCLILPTVITGLLLTLQWRILNKSVDDADRAGQQNLDPRKKNLDWAAWLLFGYGSAFVSLFPLLTLLLVFIRTDFLLEQDSYEALSVGALGISMGIVVAYSVSLVVLMRRRQGVAVQWAAVLAVNALILLSVVMTLGIWSRMLEAVMEMSSVRVENAVMMLEPEGCELLQSMQAMGWGRVQGASERTCVLYDVTIQSTLEPTMQVACWRGIIPKKGQGGAETTAPVAVTAASATSIAVSAAAVVPPASTESQASADIVRIPGHQGAFTIPTKYVRSVWKTSGVKLQDQRPVCPQILTINMGPRQVITSAEPNSTK